MKDDNARLRAAIDKLRVPIYIKDPRGRYVYANDLACELLERLRSDVLGRSDSELFPPDLADAMQAHDRREIVLTTSEKFSGYFDENEEEMQKKVAALSAQFTPEELCSAERVLLALGTLL